MKRVGKYELGNVLGEGTYATVRYAVNVDTKEPVAVKIIDRVKIADPAMAEQLKREISIMKKIRHPNVVRLNEVLQSRTKIFLVIEYMMGGDLLERLMDSENRHPHPHLSEVEARRFFHQLMYGLAYCHQQGICHRDLKCENLLTDDKGSLKISDFGLSALYDRPGDRTADQLVSPSPPSPKTSSTYLHSQSSEDTSAKQHQPHQQQQQQQVAGDTRRGSRGVPPPLHEDVVMAMGDSHMTVPSPSGGGHREVGGSLMVEGLEGGDVAAMEGGYLGGQAQQASEMLQSFMMFTACGTPHYLAPEVLSGGKPWDGRPADVWAAGVILFTLVAGNFPFDADTVADLFRNISTASYRCPDHFSSQLRSLLGQIFVQDPRKRGTIETICQHEWFNKDLPTDTHEGLARLFAESRAESTVLRSGNRSRASEPFVSVGHHGGLTPSSQSMAGTEPMVFHSEGRQPQPRGSFHSERQPTWALSSRKVSIWSVANEEHEVWEDYEESPTGQTEADQQFVSAFELINRAASSAIQRAIDNPVPSKNAPKGAQRPRWGSIPGRDRSLKPRVSPKGAQATAAPPTHEKHHPEHFRRHTQFTTSESPQKIVEKAREVFTRELKGSVSDPNPFQLHVSIPSRIRPLRTEFRLEIYQYPDREQPYLVEFYHTKGDHWEFYQILARLVAGSFSEMLQHPQPTPQASASEAQSPPPPTKSVVPAPYAARASAGPSKVAEPQPPVPVPIAISMPPEDDHSQSASAHSPLFPPPPPPSSSLPLPVSSGGLNPNRLQVPVGLHSPAHSASEDVGTHSPASQDTFSVQSAPERRTKDPQGPQQRRHIGRIFRALGRAFRRSRRRSSASSGREDGAPSVQHPSAAPAAAAAAGAAVIRSEAPR